MTKRFYAFKPQGKIKLPHSPPELNFKLYLQHLWKLLSPNKYWKQFVFLDKKHDNVSMTKWSYSYAHKPYVKVLQLSNRYILPTLRKRFKVLPMDE